ncbi:MAG: vWA domain-containing protein [Planctomycetota bacterium]
MDRLPFELDRPWVLLAGAAALWLTVRIARRSIAGQPPGWLRFTLALRILLVVLLILSLGGVKVALKGKGFTLLVLRDVSASVPLRESEAILAQVAPHAEDQPGDVKIGLVVFGRNAAVEFAPRRAAGPPLSLGSLTSVVDREGTSIAAALRLAESAFTASHAGGARQVLLVTDGNATQGDELLEARNLALSGTVVDVIPIRYSHDREVLVDGLLVPPVVHPDEPFVVEAVIDSKVDTRARVQLYENDTLLETRELELLAGKTRVEVPLTRAGEGRYRYEVRVFPEPQSDSLTKNNVGHAFTMIHGEARVLFVGDAGEQSPLLQALTDSRIAC